MEFNVVFICISQIARGLEHFHLMPGNHFNLFFQKKCLPTSFTYLLTRLLVLLSLKFWSSLYILGMRFSTILLNASSHLLEWFLLLRASYHHMSLFITFKFFMLKIILSDIEIVILPYFLFHIPANNHFHTFTFIGERFLL